MIDLIIRRWIKDYQNTNDRKVRESYIVLSGIVGILCNLLLFGVKLTAGLVSNSIAVISDAFNNLTDMGSSLVSILGAKLSSSPPDQEHPFGHGRIEYIASLVIAFIIFGVGFELLRNSYHQLRNPEKVIFSHVTLAILVASVLVKLWMFSYNLYLSKKIKSSINKGTAYDSLNDSIATGVVILSMILGRLWDFPIDGLAGMAVSLFIIYAGFDIARDTVNLLLGSAPDPEVAARINEIVKNGRHVIGTHELEIHDYGPNRVLASIHAEVPDHVNIVEVHSSIDTLENQINQELGIEIVVHMDPISTDNHKIDTAWAQVSVCLNDMERDVRLENFRIAQGENKVIVIFDLEILGPIPESEYLHLTRQVRQRIEAGGLNYEVVIDKVGRCKQIKEVNGLNLFNRKGVK